MVSVMPYINKLIDILGIPQINKKGFEADDIIGTLSGFGKEQGWEVVIVSGDKDFAQLIDPKVSMYDTMKNKVYDEQAVVEKWGVHPDQFIDYLALIGDSSDNIPGVRGVGPKTAEKLLAEYKTLEGVYENVENVSGKALKAKLADNKDMAYLSKELVTIVRDIELGVAADDLKIKPIDRDALSEILEELEFKSFEKKLFSSREKNSATKKDLKSSTTKAKATPSVKVAREKVEVKDAEVVQMSAAEIQKAIDAYSEVWTVDAEGETYLYNGKSLILPQDDLSNISDVLSSKHLFWKGYDLKNVWHKYNIDLPRAACDLMLSAYIVKPENVGKIGKVTEKYLDEKVPDLASVNDMLKLQINLENEFSKLVKQVNGQSVLDEIELPLLPALYEMERNGIRLDSSILKEQSQELETDLADLEKTIHDLAGEPFNISSPKQLGSILFEKLGLPPSKKTKTGYSTNSDVLMGLKDEHPICELILQFREDAKLKSTYVDSLPKLVNSETGRIHTQFNQAVTTTGRLSSVNPNLQNIPIRTERGRRIRKAFVTDPNHQLLSADYSQIELRVLAHITEDPGLIRAFENDQDVHAITASEIYGVSLEDVTSEQRRNAKAVNFGIAYGQGAYGLAETLGISRSEGKQIIDTYFSKFKKIKDYMVNVVEEAKANGYVEMLSGRRRYLEELEAKQPAVRKFGERAAINAPMQGTAADIVKLAMIKSYESIQSKMLLQVHDELIFSCNELIAEEEQKEVTYLMENAFQLNVPLKVNSSIGVNWDEAH